MAELPPGQQTLTIQQAIDLGVEHHNAGRLPEAENVYNQILQAEPRNFYALHYLGMVAHQVGKNDVAAKLIAKALAIKPDYVEAHFNLGNVYKEWGKLDNAVSSYDKALAINPNFMEAHSNLGLAYKEQGKLDEAVTSYRKALTIRSDSAEVHYNLGGVLMEQGKLDEAVTSYRKSLSIKPNDYETHGNLGSALKEQGKLDEAVASYHKALDIKPDYAEAHDNLILLLNRHTPTSNFTNQYLKAQVKLQKVQLPNACDRPISDGTIIETYQRCEAILRSHQIPLQSRWKQIWRGQGNELGCKRHKHVFDTQNIIPEFCFGCFKVAITPRTVVELFKLNAVFNYLDLPNDNTRKCHIEVRQEISGAYKGLIYCWGLSEAQDVVNLVQPVVHSAIGNDMPISIKRGCSEFPLAYPNYGHVGENGAPLMTYDNAWKEQEALADNNFIKSNAQHVFYTHNHQGHTLQDVLIMRSWLTYAAAIGDLSYLKVSGALLDKMNIEGREPFQDPI